MRHQLLVGKAFVSVRFLVLSVDSGWKQKGRPADHFRNDAFEVLDGVFQVVDPRLRTRD